jgi:hypothetical protein
MEFSAGGYTQIEFASPAGDLIVSETNLASTIVGTHLRVSDFNDTATYDRNWLTNGKIERTGYGLPDTSALVGLSFGAASVGEYGMRFEPDDDGAGTELLAWTQSFPTGDIQNKVMQVITRIEINSASYWGGTHTNPTLRVKYDNSTEVTAVATDTTNTQLLAVTFTPLTTFGQIVITMEMATDASGSDAYVYVGSMVPNLPDGVAVDTTQLAQWANAMPVLPSIATIRNPTNLWDELIVNHDIDGSFGELVQEADAKDDIT